MPLIAYLILFVTIAVGFIFVHLLVGAFLRPFRPGEQKESIYECGEETIGSAWIQFDVRYYVIALLFVIFDVEVLFFFPWAEVFGKANAVANAPRPAEVADYHAYGEKVLDLAVPYVPGANRLADRQVAHLQAMTALSPEELDRLRQQQSAVQEKILRGENLADLDVATLRLEGFLQRPPMAATTEKQRLTQGLPARTEYENHQERSQSLALFALIEMGVFFGVLLIGFAYLWRRGDLEWVRAQGAPPVSEGVQS
jgi:NADH:ubiquinone oxidoreductase subunit 3 (subunit A)